jgi:hypothetical protein
MSALLEQGLYSLLSGNSPQTQAAGRIYPRLPQGVTFPAIIYTRITTDRTQSLNANVGVTEATMVVDCIAESYSEAKTLADEVRTILHGYSGAWSTLICRNCVLESESDESEQDGDRVTHWVTHVYRIWTNMD